MQYLRASLIFATFVCAHGAVLVNKNQEPSFTHSAVLDSAGLVNLQWAYNDTYIVFELKVETVGWIAMGVSPTGSMKGSDIACMWMAGSKPVLKDMYAENNGLPIEDSSQDLDMISGSQDGGFTKVTFGRKLEACDENDKGVSEDTLRVIFAFGTENPSDKLAFEDKHQTSNRGSRSIRLINQQRQPVAPEGEGINVIEILNDKVEVPAKDTYYHCKIHKMDFKKQKQHVIQFEPIIEKGNEKVVHHIVMYTCTGLENSVQAGTEGQECNTPNMPEEYRNCSSAFFAWAIGGGKFTYPQHTGLLVDDSKETVYLMVETHYDNPDEKSGIVDSSGMRLISTSNLRDNDVAILSVGATVSQSHFIPAGSKSWKTLGTCPIDCLSSGLPDGQDSIQIIATLLHAHLFGVQLKLRHFRDGIELPPISEERFYDFNYQEYNHLQKEITVKKGDELMVECIYQTGNEAIFGGFGTGEEMCFAFIQHYPKLDLNQCYSSPEPTGLYTALNIPTSVWNDELVNGDYLNFPSLVTKVKEGNFDVVQLNEQYNALSYYGYCIFHEKEASLSLHNQTKKTAYVYPEPNCPGGQIRITSCLVGVLGMAGLLALVYK